MTVWTEEMNADLYQLKWVSGLSYSQVAAKLNEKYGTEITRKAAQAKGCRLGQASFTPPTNSKILTETEMTTSQDSSRNSKLVTSSKRLLALLIRFHGPAKLRKVAKKKLEERFGLRKEPALGAAHSGQT